MAVVMQFSVLPAGIVLSLGTGGSAAVDSFGDYPDEIKVPLGTSYADAAAILPANIPATVVYEETAPAKTYAEAAVVWTGGDYDPDMPGVYLFTASFYEAGWTYAGDLPEIAMEVTEDPPVEEPMQGEESPPERDVPAGDAEGYGQGRGEKRPHRCGERIGLY